MKQYRTPQIEILSVNTNEILCTSNIGNSSVRMSQKYNVFTQLILNSHPDCRIFKDTSNNLEVGAVSYGGANAQVYSLKEKGNQVLITMKCNHPMFGNYERTWQFAQTKSQEQMLEQISRESFEDMQQRMSAFCGSF